MKTLLAVCLALSACVTDPAGLLLGAPVAVTTTQQRAIRIKLPGIGENPPATASLPPFDQLPDAILGGIAVPDGISPIGAMSLGQDVFYAEEPDLTSEDLLDGAPPPPNSSLRRIRPLGHGWLTVGFTVDRAQLGSDPLAPDVAEARDKGELDRSAFAYVVPGSSGEWLPEEEGESVRIMDPEALGLPSEDDAIHAVDLHAALYHTDLGNYRNVFTTRPLDPDIWVYFTLSPEFLGSNINPAPTLSAAWGVTIDTGTIYLTHWINGAWTMPIVYRTWQQIGLQPTTTLAPAPVIDGLAIDAVDPGVVTNVEDEILLSLASSPYYPSAAADQMLYFTGPPALPGVPPRRVIVWTNDAYGSLGVQMGAGRALADFCTSDPWGKQRQALDKPMLDDFFVARRLSAPWLLPPWLAAATFPTFVPGYWAMRPPELALAISGYRFIKEGSPHMRTCMSWRCHRKGAKAVAIVRWGSMPDVLKNPVFPGDVSWEGSQLYDYRGKPLVHDVPLLDDGYLRLGGPPRAEKLSHARVAQWFLWRRGRLYRSPIAALRY